VRKSFYLITVLFAAIFSGTLHALPLEESRPGHIRVGDSTIFFNIRATLSDSLATTNYEDTKTHIDNSAYVRLRVNGEISPQFRWRASGTVYSDKTNREIEPHFYEPKEGLPYNLQGDNGRSWDTFTAYSEYNSAFGKLMAGIDYLEWGPAKRNKLVLRGSSNNYRPWMDTTYFLSQPAPTPFFGFQFSTGPITYTQYSGKLFYEKNKNKFFHANRLDFALPFEINFGVSETVIYGSTVTTDEPNLNHDADSTDRDFEWVYAVPFVPYVFAQNYLGDKDNAGLSFDLSIKTIPNWEIYGELLWDDMNNVTSMFDDSWWGNKWGASIGASTENRAVGPVLVSWMSEYTHIEPWVYTHHLGASHQYTNYGQCLGSELGPNSQELYTQLDMEWKIFKLSLHASGVSKDTAFGSNISDIHITPENPELVPTAETYKMATDKKFLADATTKSYQEYGFAITIAPWEWLWARYAQSVYVGDYEGMRIEGSLGVTW